MKIYTGGGDRGRTGLFSGERVVKSDPRVEAYGEVDELSSVIGGIAAFLPEVAADSERDAIERTISTAIPTTIPTTIMIRRIQSDLLTVGALLATTPDSDAFGHIPRLSPDRAKALEAAMDAMDAVLPELKAFILPGGHPSAAWAHTARAVCRRAERRITALFLQEGPEEIKEVLVYINRLSDYLFVLARYCNKIAGVADIEWKPE